MLLEEFQYDLPPELIAQQPAERRAESRLMVIDRGSGRIGHHLFKELPELLRMEDLLVLNDTKVFPARLFGMKVGGTARIEVLLLRQLEENDWEVLLRPARKAKPGTRLVFQKGAFEGEVLRELSEGKRLFRLKSKGPALSWIEQVGQVPLPPYIRRPDGISSEMDRRRYQTVYARETGSIAAPTAGLHFTRELLEGLQHCAITLHVGYGTFRPVKTEPVEEHRMEEEYYSIGPFCVEKIRETQATPEGRVIAVGTTTTRALETAALDSGEIVESSGWTRLFIYPGFKFNVLDGLITNFHLPGSTLLMLVAALASKDLIERAYEIAVKERYRFYSYGDAMLIL